MLPITRSETAESDSVEYSESESSKDADADAELKEDRVEVEEGAKESDKENAAKGTDENKMSNRHGTRILQLWTCLDTIYTYHLVLSKFF